MSNLRNVLTIELNQVFSLSIINLDYNGEHVYFGDWCEVYIVDSLKNRRLLLLVAPLGSILSDIGYATSRNIEQKTIIYPDIEVFSMGKIYNKLLTKDFQYDLKESYWALDKSSELITDFGFLNGKGIHTWMYCKDNIVFFELTERDDSDIFNKYESYLSDKSSLKMIPTYTTISNEYLLKIMEMLNYCFLELFPDNDAYHYPDYGIYNPFD